MGLLDHNGQRIFEGDIVRVDPTCISGANYDGLVAVVGFADCSFGLEPVSLYRHYDEKGWEHQFGVPFWTKGLGACLVIGNIHDSPSLLTA